VKFTKIILSYNKMNIYLEALLRTLGVFLGVFFTVGWGRKSKPAFDVFLIIFAVVLAVALAFMQPGAAKAVSKPIVASIGPAPMA
jgi:hypothetical protein